MEKVCRWCKHYENGMCLRLAEAIDVDTLGERRMSGEDVEIYIREPEGFYCKEWE